MAASVATAGDLRAQAPAAALPLAERVESIIFDAPFDRGHWGIVVEDARTGERLLQRNAEQLFIPASSMKLIVATAAARLLGQDFRYRTTLHATGPVVDGALRGHLVLRGTGDPTLSGRYQDSVTAVWHALTDSLRARGVQRIEGRVIADATTWEPLTLLGEWEAYDMLWWYAAPVAALGFNDNSIDFTVAPGPVGERARISGQPATSYYHLRNETITIAAGGTKTLDFDRLPGTDTILAYGEIPADAPVRTEHFAVADPVRYALTTFREALEHGGITVADSVLGILRDRAAVDTTVQPIATWTSPPLDSVIGPILKSSQNWFAEQLLKTVGERVGNHGSWKTAIDVERAFLVDSVGIDSTAFSIRDGSGLSTGNLVTPNALARLLRYVYAQPDLRIVRDALPRGGEPDTSLRSRLADLGERVRAKTGSMRNTVSLSGFVTTDDGRDLVFVIMANTTGLGVSFTNGAIDRIVRAIAESG